MAGVSPSCCNPPTNIPISVFGKRLDYGFALLSNCKNFTPMLKHGIRGAWFPEPFTLTYLKSKPSPERCGGGYALCPLGTQVGTQRGATALPF